MRHPGLLFLELLGRLLWAVATLPVRLWRWQRRRRNTVHSRRTRHLRKSALCP